MLRGCVRYAKRVAVVAFGWVMLVSSAARADWTVQKARLGPGYVVRHDSGSPALVVSTRFRTKRAAEAAAKALNQAEAKSVGGDHETDAGGR